MTKSLKCGIIVKSAASGRWPAAKMNPLVALQGGNVDLVCQTVALSGANLRTLPMVNVRHLHPLLRHWGNPPMFGTCIGTS